jgi:hypothetical protein
VCFAASILSFIGAFPAGLTQRNRQPIKSILMQVLYPIICPHCRKPGKVPAELEGKSIRCRACQKTFLVKLPPQTNAGITYAQAPIRHATFSKQRFWGIFCLVSIFLVIAFDLFWWFGLDWESMDDFFGFRSISRGLKVWTVVISFFVILPLGVFGFILLILNPRAPKAKKR